METARSRQPEPDGRNELGRLRDEIDEVDNQIISLLGRRMDLVKQVGEYKRDNNIPPLDSNRWQEVLDSRLSQARSLGLDEGFVGEIYERIHDQALEIEEGTKGIQ